MPRADSVSKIPTEEQRSPMRAAPDWDRQNADWCGGSEVRIISHEFAVRTSESKPREIDNLLVSLKEEP
jgi:hypothetical protein